LQTHGLFSVAWQVNIRAVKEKCLQSDRFASIFYLFLLFAVGFGLAQPDLRLKFFGLSAPLFFGLCPPRGAALGAGYYKTRGEAFAALRRLEVVEPAEADRETLEEGYRAWVREVEKRME